MTIDDIGNSLPAAFLDDSGSIDAPTAGPVLVDPFHATPALGYLKNVDSSVSPTATTDLDPPRPVEATATQLTSMTTSLSNISQMENDIYALMAMIIKLNISQKQADRQARNAECEAMVKTMEHAAHKIEEAALKRFVGAMVSACVSFATAGLQTGGAIKAQRIQESAPKPIEPQTKTYAKLATESKAEYNVRVTQLNHQENQMVELSKQKYQKFLDRANQVAQIYQPAGNLGSEVGRSSSAAADYAAAADDKEKALLDALAKSQENHLDLVKDWISTLVTLLNDTLDALKQMQQGQHASRQTAATGRA